jgi:LytS/YehU family sensor histidine kinase
MNPHFVFNAMNTLASIISTSTPAASNAYLVSFSKLLRRILANTEKVFLPMQEEMENIRTYIALQEVRFTHGLDWEIKFSPELASAEIPTLLLQPFVENALQHGIAHSPEKGKLTVECKGQARNLVITIRDNGIGRLAAARIARMPGHVSRGMELVERKAAVLKSKYDIDVQVQILDNEEESTGTAVFIRITKGKL